MIFPITECFPAAGSSACVIGLAWLPEQLVAFLAWWMPLNLLSWLALMALVLGSGGRMKQEARALQWQLWMTVGFYPTLAWGVIHAYWTRWGQR